MGEAFDLEFFVEDFEAISYPMLIHRAAFEHELSEVFVPGFEIG
jgi:hypothetical protein